MPLLWADEADSILADTQMAAGPYDPLGSRAPLPLEAELFPMGYALRIATNSERVLAAAWSVWSRFPRLSDESPVRLNIDVVAADVSLPLPAPVFRGREHLLSIAADRMHFAIADLRAGYGMACLSEHVSCDSLRYYFLEPLAYVLIAARHLTFLHAACVSLNGRSVVLCGDSGAGKTCLAFACARAGWTFLSGDATAIVRGRLDHKVLGRPFEIRFRQSACELFPELRAYPQTARPNGKADIEIDPHILGLSCALEGTASHVVFLERSPGHMPASLHPFRRNEAQSRLEQAICFGDESIRGEQRRAVTEFLKLPTMRLRYSGLGSAEQVLRRLVEG
jgi:hypothetical protein